MERTFNIEGTDNSIQIEKAAKKSNVRKKVYFFLKRFFDIICAIVGCLFLAPLYVVIKICYVLDGDFSPVVYTQNRIGKNGREFKFYKFRSMIPNADEALERLLKDNPELAKEYKTNKKLENDPRITKIGNFLRKTSMDEFPQFINVIKGDMAVIGNRPYLPREKADMGDYYYDIIKTKCGIISYWAIMGRNDVSFEDRLKLESFYSNNQSFSLDAKIFINVFPVVLLKKGAK